MKKKVDPYDIDAFLSHENAAAPPTAPQRAQDPRNASRRTKRTTRPQRWWTLRRRRSSRGLDVRGQAVAKEATTSYGLRSPAPVVVLDEDDEDEAPQQGSQRHRLSVRKGRAIAVTISRAQGRGESPQADEAQPGGGEEEEEEEGDFLGKERA